ncbi:MAG: hypothetical protein DRN53_05700 [Thermoprotei archaeon]|nr:MAG: hypothetical protein DRN53_05700 [Thermoprotei archaeon]
MLNEGLYHFITTGICCVRCKETGEDKAWKIEEMYRFLLHINIVEISHKDLTFLLFKGTFTKLWYLIFLDGQKEFYIQR